MLSKSVEKIHIYGFFQTISHILDLQASASSFQLQTGAIYKSDPIFFKTNVGLSLPAAINGTGTGLGIEFSPLILSSSGTFENKDYVQFNHISNLNNSGRGILSSVTNINQVNNSFPKPQLKGCLRFNLSLDRFEGNNGVDWVPLN